MTTFPILTYDERVKRLNTFFQTGRLIRHDFTGTINGKATACLLAAMSPEVGRAENPSACPADVMPGWFAELTPTLDDAGSLDAWHSMVQRYAQLAADWHRLGDAAWNRLRALAVRIALSEVSQIPKNLLSQTIGYWESPDEVSEDQWKSLRLTICTLDKKNDNAAPGERFSEGFLDRNHDYQLRRHGWGAMMEAAKTPPSVGALWFRTTRSSGSDPTDWEPTCDRMTNLIFDAMQVEIDKAKAPN